MRQPATVEGILPAACDCDSPTTVMVFACATHHHHLRLCRGRPDRYPRDHPFAQLQGSDNIITFTTERYHATQPLVVRGPGAGADVTAGGVFGDIVQLLRCCGMRRV